MLTTISSRQALETEGLPSDRRLPGITESSTTMDGETALHGGEEGAGGGGEEAEDGGGGWGGAGEKKQKMDGVVSLSSNSGMLPEILIPGAICSLAAGFIEHGNTGLIWHGGRGARGAACGLLWDDKKPGFDSRCRALRIDGWSTWNLPLVIREARQRTLM